MNARAALARRALNGEREVIACEQEARLRAKYGEDAALPPPRTARTDLYRPNRRRKQVYRVPAEGDDGIAFLRFTQPHVVIERP